MLCIAIFCLQLHPLQQALSEDDRMQSIERMLVTATSQVGMDLNAAVSHEWMASPLAYVPGLGPRKARQLLEAIRRFGGRVEGRRELLTDMDMGRTVFLNCAPTLRIRSSGASMSNEEMDVLDNTRIHPESYDFAKQMAKDAMDGEKGNEELLVERAMENPGRLDDLDLKVMGETSMVDLTALCLNEFHRPSRSSVAL